MACSYLSVSIFWTLLSELWWARANHVALLLTLMPRFRLISVLLSVIPLITSLAGALHYLTFTRPDISYAVQQICLHMHDSREPHLSSVKRVIQYLRGTLNYALLLHRGTLQSWLYILMLIGPLLPLTSTSGHSTNSIGWSRKTYKPRIYNTWCAQAPIALRYANLA